MIPIAEPGGPPREHLGKLPAVRPRPGRACRSPGSRIGQPSAERPGARTTASPGGLCRDRGPGVSDFLPVFVTIARPKRDDIMRLGRVRDRPDGPPDPVSLIGSGGPGKWFFDNSHLDRRRQTNPRRATKPIARFLRRATKPIAGNGPTKRTHFLDVSR